MKIKNILFYIILGSILLYSSYMQAAIGESSFSLLEKGVNPRIEALGGAGVGLSKIDDSSYNPSAIANVNYQGIRGGFHNYISGIKSYYGDLVYPVQNGEYGVVSIGFQYWSLFEGLKLYDENGIDTGVTLDGNNMFLIAGYGYNVKNINLGVNIKYLSESLNEKYSGFGVDLGVQYFMNKKIIVGLSIDNIGGKIAEDSLPLRISSGIGYIKDFSRKSTVKSINFVAQFNYIVPTGCLNYGAGAEIEFKNIKLKDSYAQPYLRLGVSLPASELGGSLSMLNIGFGFSWNQFQIDYLFNPYSQINEYHNSISLTYKFKIKKEVSEEELEKAIKSLNKKENKKENEKKKEEVNTEEEF